MDDVTNRPTYRSALGLAAYLVASARDCLEAPAVYGAYRLLEATSRLAELAVAEGDPFLVETKQAIDRNKDLLMRDQKAFVAWLDELLEAVATEVKRRNLAS
jgi:Family of unknown function (DUF6092)